MKYPYTTENIDALPNLSRRLFIRNNAVAVAGFMVLPSWIKKGQNNTFNKAAVLVPDALLPLTTISVSGFIGKKLDLSYQNRVFAQDVDALIEPFRHRNETRLWQTEFWGKWITSAILAYRYDPQPKSKEILDKAVRDLISTQTPDGYIGNYQLAYHLQQWDIWGRKYVLLGLLDYYDLTKDKASLEAAIKLINHLLKELAAADGKIVNKGNFRGMAASSILGGIVRLYLLTDDKAYMDFAESIVEQWETPEGPQLLSKASVNVAERFTKPDAKNWYSWEQGQKAYEMMSCYEGLIELYKVTGKKNYLSAVQDTWTNIRDTEINIAGSGASHEMWFGGKDHQTAPVGHYQETCVTVTWIRLTQQLLRLTGQEKYAHEIEKSYYNALMGALSADAAVWAKYTPLDGQRLPGSGQCGMELNCCEANGPRGQFLFPFTAVMSLKNGLCINFFVPGDYQFLTPAGKKATLMIQTDFPVSGKVTIKMKLARPEKFVLRVRNPEWSSKTEFIVDGQYDVSTAGGYGESTKLWTSDDVIEINFDMSGRVISQGTDHRYTAILRGPLVLCRDSSLGNDLGVTLAPVKDSLDRIALKMIQKSASNSTGTTDKALEDVWVQCEAPFLPEFYKDGPFTAKAVMVRLCDYSSAGNEPKVAGSSSASTSDNPASFQVWSPQLYDPRYS